MTTSEEDMIAEKTQRLRLFENLCDELKNCRVLEAELDIKVIFYDQLVQLDTLIENWPIDESLDLGEYLSREEIDWLLNQAVNNNLTYEQFCLGKRLVEFVARSGYRDERRPAETLSRTTPIHRAARCNHCRNYGPIRRRYNYDESNVDALIDKLFKIYDNFGANYVDEQGTTHFHVACWHGCAEAVQKFLAAGLEPDCPEYPRIDPPLHLAARANRKEMVEILLRNGADPNLTNDYDQTPLHLISSKDDEDVVAVDAFFAVCDQVGRRVEVDARDRDGNTPLHEAARCRNKRVMATLLRRGADPNAANKKGLTPLHAISDREDNMPELMFHIDDGDDDDDDDAMEAFFKVNDEIQGQVLRVDAEDGQGRTPLILALLRCRKKTIETLLRRGADPNLPNARGSTPLHVLCRVYCEDEYEDNLARLFLEIVAELRLTVRIDATDNEGRTALQWAVVNFLPNTIDALLDHGADLASLVFPTENHFREELERQRHVDSVVSQSRLPIGALMVVDRLEAGGYETTLDDAVTIMRLLRRWLAETWTRGFLLKWALPAYLELTRYRLPILCCEMIIAKLTNEDLYNICLAAAGWSS